MDKKRGIKGRKAQITAFMLIGIVILVIFSSMYLLSSSMKTQRIEQQIDIVAEKITETNLLKQYVTMCVKNSLEEGLVVAGKQGGKLFNDDPEDYVDYQGYRLGYGIRAKELDPIGPDVQYPGPPHYPCVNKPGTSSYPCQPSPYNPVTNPVKLYPFGESSLPFLCDPYGPNAVYLDVFPYPCPTGTYGPDSLQEQLNAFIAIELAECVALEGIEQITDLKITSGQPNVTVLLTEDGIIARATYPLNMSLGGYSSMRFFDFEVELPVRIKKIFGLADHIVKKEVFDIRFNATRDFREYKFFGKDLLPLMNITRYNVGPGVDAIEINDSVSLIQGRPYSFRFAVESRIPALDPVSDIHVNAGETISITPQGHDPDDNDVLSYSIEGWGSWSFSGGSFTCTAQAGDAGTQEIIVKVCDDSALCDWQPVSIEVSAT